MMPRLCTAWMALALAPVVARAEDKAPPVPSAPAEDSISAAKRDLELIKSARNPALQPGTSMPQVSLPELHSAGPEAYLKSAPTKAESSKQKSANWLVEAMEKSRDYATGKEHKEHRVGTSLERDADETDPSAPDRARGAPPGGARVAGGTGSTGARPGDGASEHKPGDAAVFNPLTPFLSDWMTPHDFALLGTSLQKTARSGDDGSPAPAGVGAGIDFGGVSPAALAIGGAASTRPAVASTPRENPFLEALNPPTMAPMPTSAAASVAPVQAPSSPSVFSAPPPPPSIGPAKPKLPDFVKPQADEKYFKPLKRF